MGNRFMNPYFEPLIQTLIVALRSSKLKAVHPNQKTGPLYELTNLDKRCLYNYNFSIKLIRENYIEAASYLMLIEDFYQK